MPDEKFIEFKRIWGVDGMPADKIKLATAAFADGRAAGIAWAEKFTAGQCLEIFDEYFRRAGYKAGSEFVRNEFIKKFGLEI